MRELWQKRLRQHLMAQARYLKLVFNDQFTIVLFVIFGAALYGYAQFVRGMSATTAHWLPYVVLVVLAAAVRVGQVVTLLTDADATFLLPRAAGMGNYLLAAMRYSLVLPVAFTVLLVVAAWPILAATWHVGSAAIICLAVTAALVQYGDLMLQTNALLMDQPAQVPHRISLVVLMALSVYATQLPVYWFPVVAASLMDVVLRVWLEQRLRRGQVALLTAARRENSRMQRIYRVYSMFTDVPGLRATIKRRRWLDGWLRTGSRQQRRTWDYLYLRGFIRRPEYGNLFIRLTVIAVVLMCLSTVAWVSMLIGLVAMYLTAIQIVPLATQYREIVFAHLYPLSATARTAALRRLLFSLMLVQTVIFALTGLIMVGVLAAAESVVAGVVLTVLVAGWYVPRFGQRHLQW
ncbi:ABC transporter permease [Lacticaseibacillus thailandensis]|uniref:ABC transporter permease n=1 Tax=Lacticaseibacillus thailandensis DSM 22698 = JCM 13996 TaxID=1423810 RepID=A0A0R2CDB2_9LACO|nr:ABC transporter permease [Lacticaseibacillus thailandensis]KRM87972.1 ABC transporter permease [Lacticaseibacillus thailandensis DSM 22698 = JCM 13996]